MRSSARCDCYATLHVSKGSTREGLTATAKLHECAGQHLHAGHELQHKTEEEWSTYVRAIKAEARRGRIRAVEGRNGFVAR